MRSAPDAGPRGVAMSSSSTGGPFPWELRAAASVAERGAELGADDDQDSAASSDDYEELKEEQFTEDEAGDRLVDFLFDLLTTRRKMSAANLCKICWWANKAGAKGSVGKFGLHPRNQSGIFQRHLDRAAGISLAEDAKTRYFITTPVVLKKDAYRTAHPVPVNVPHEAANEEILARPAIVDEVKRKQWPPAYYDNPIVRKFGWAVPFAIFVDGVPTTKRDSVYGVWLYNLATMSRHLIAVYRKSSLCRCGCGHWCTWSTLWAFLAWSFEAMANAQFPGASKTIGPGSPPTTPDPRTRIHLWHIEAYYCR